MGPLELRPTDEGVRGLLRLAWPLILSNSFWMLQISIDRIVLGHYSADAMAASMAAALFFWTPMNMLHITVGYVATFVAQYSGADRPERTGPAAWQALYAATIGGGAFLLLIPAADALFAWAGHSSAIRADEVVYFQVLCVSALPTLWMAAASGFFSGRGDSRTVLLINTVGLLINAPLTVAWVFGWWGFPEAGIAGAGWATALATTVAALLALALMFRPAFRGCNVAGGWRFDAALFGRLMRFGLPAGVQVGLDAAAWTLLVMLIGRMGDAQLAATTVAFTLNLLVFMPTMGLAQAVGVLVGQALGENRPDRAERSCHQGLALGLGLTAALGVLYLAIPQPLALLFLGEATAAAALVPTLLRFVVVYCLFDAVNLIYMYALRGAGDTRFVTLAAVSLAWTIMVLPTYILWRLGGGLYEAWTAASIYIMILAGVFWLRFRYGPWRRMRVIEPTTTPTPPVGATEQRRLADSFI